MECIKALRENDSLTVQEVAERLGLEPAMAKSQFLKLRQLGLIEQAGCRETAAGIQAAYRLNVRNPALEFVLAPAPEGMRSPYEVAERRRSWERGWEPGGVE
jgi:Mn-dependent DtxR family transcriptional regulator